MYLVSLADRHCKPVWQIEQEYSDEDITEFMALDRLKNDQSYRNKIEFSTCDTPQKKTAYIQRKLEEQRKRNNR
ncbi:hypothetical protein [Marinobacterium lutimaris]|uniref:Uncharacterized protein n=1 Tax=Marinobacterium lutimaris TaxID=568106 RepID=A0A1H5Y950_9GAMM|nr:hypothetical protein [Marinobacterium lutimaris]SEG20295.1 hypothetical protein SAMN05444390_1011660 [Marinobacterium lutimaris]